MRCQPSGGSIITECMRPVTLYPTTMDLPQDPFMLLSTINMKLRDAYPSLDALCDDLQIDRQTLEEKLAAAGFTYAPEHNKFW